MAPSIVQRQTIVGDNRGLRGSRSSLVMSSQRPLMLWTHVCHSVLVLLLPLRRCPWPGGDHAEQPMLLVSNSGGEEQRTSASVVLGATAEPQGPEAVNGERISLRVDKLPDEVAAGVEGVDASVAKISHQHITAEL